MTNKEIIRFTRQFFASESIVCLSFNIICGRLIQGDFTHFLLLWFEVHKIKDINKKKDNIYAASLLNKWKKFFFYCKPMSFIEGEKKH